MIIDFKTVIPSVVALWYLVKRWVNEFSKIADPLIAEAERLAQDGMIDKEDRKRLVWCALLSLEKQGKIKLNFITKLIAIWLIDRLAARLPDFTISKNAQELLNCTDKKPS
jgi:hypothetical protein